MNFTGKLKNDLYYDGIKIVKGKSYIWKGECNTRFYDYRWKSSMKVIDIIDGDIYIKSSDDGKLTLWRLEDITKSNITIEYNFLHKIFLSIFG